LAKYGFEKQVVQHTKMYPKNGLTCSTFET